MKRVRGVPVLHDELKKTHAVRLTDSAWRLITEKAKIDNTSASELIENWARNLAQEKPS